MIIRVDPISLTALILLAILLGFVVDDHLEKPKPVTNLPDVTVPTPGQIITPVPNVEVVPLPSTEPAWEYDKDVWK